MMDFSYPFDEYQSTFLPFGMDGIPPPESTQTFIGGEPESLFPQDPASLTDVCVSQDYSMESNSFVTETGSPVLPNSASVTESSPASTSPLSSPGGSSYIEVKQEPFSQQEQTYSTVDMSSTDMSTNTISFAPERKKKRPAAEPKAAKKHTQPQGTGKKRKAQSEPTEELNPEYLLQMNSVELEEMHQRLQFEGRLKPEDDKLMKKVIRQVKNRESAQASRIRRRDHIEFIEAKLKHEELVADRWHAYADMLKGMLIKQGMQVPPEPEIPAFVPPPPSELSVVESSRPLVRPLRTAGICLMIVVLSVGILFNAMHHTATGSSISTTVNGNPDSKTLVSAPSAPVDPSTRVIVDGSSRIGQLPPTPEGISETSSGEASTQNSDVASLDVIRKSAYLSYDTDKVDSSLALVIPDHKNQASAATTTPAATTPSSMVPVRCPVMRYTTKAIFGDAQPHVADRSWSMDNTSYILVNDATEFVPRSAYMNSMQTRTEPVIGLLLPASSFNITNSAPDDVVELICGVRNANLVPRSVLAHSL